jgi:cell wall-associated NlpC family hydrolase
VRYVAGGTSPSRGFDCSGYTRYVYSRLGIGLPRVSRDQYRAGLKISRAQAVPGDLVFFTSSSGRIHHVAIYAGNGYVWHSPYPGKRVKLEHIWTSHVLFARVRA